MEEVVRVGRAPPASTNRSGDASKKPLKSGIGPPTALYPRSVRTFFSYKVFMTVLIFATTCFQDTVSEQINLSNFSLQSATYSCASTLICLGEAHDYVSAVDGDNGIVTGMLSLLSEVYNSSVESKGIAYYKEPVKMIDRSTGQAANFNTSFIIYRRNNTGTSSSTGDGMTFVISANDSTLGGAGGNFGIFSEQNSTTSFKSIVVEFDTFLNNWYPIWDISNNHVSLDFNNITWVTAVDASDVNVFLYREFTVFVWVEYSRETEQLEVRISYENNRPGSPLLNYEVNLFDFVEEDMWVGFSSGAGVSYSNFYIGDWAFESYGNLNVSSPAPQGGRGDHALVLGISVAVPAFLLVCMAIAFFVHRCGYRCAYRQCQLFWGCIQEEETIPIEGMPERFSYRQLSAATKNFNEGSKLGQGGFGSVYHGVLPSSRIQVAVKKIKRDSAQGQKEFMAEVSIISQLRHRNLIQLLGWCKDVAREKYLLVYELMPKGSLDKVLFVSGPSGKETACLSWQQRLNVVTGTAAALDYLHRGWKQQVIHRDIKSSNIMLDGEWNAKLGDFGLARLVDHQCAATTTAVAGTYGYIAPEAAVTGHFTDKSDVFAFGAVVLEVACGRRAMVAHLSPEEMILVDWVWERLSEGALLSTVDRRLEDYDMYWMEVILILGLLCSHPNPAARPSMRQVVEVLAGDVPVPSIPTSKPHPFSSVQHSSVISFDEISRDLNATGNSTSRYGSISLVPISDSNGEYTCKSHVSASESTTKL